MRTKTLPKGNWRLKRKKVKKQFVFPEKIFRFTKIWSVNRLFIDPGVHRREGVVSASGPSREIVSFRSCVRAGGRRARDQIDSGYLGVFAGWWSRSRSASRSRSGRRPLLFSIFALKIRFSMILFLILVMRFFSLEKQMFFFTFLLFALNFPFGAFNPFFTTVLKTVVKYVFNTFFTTVWIYSRKMHMFFFHYWRSQEPPVSLSCGEFRSSFAKSNLYFSKGENLQR